MIERLSFAEAQNYNAQEASVHLARYNLAIPYCSDKTVLDVACGEGYGSRYLFDAGAKEVWGLDVDPKSVQVASELFGNEKVSYLAANAEDLITHFGVNRFDLVVSLETIEHVEDPRKFLEGIRAVATDDATIVISCPNDHWFYPQPESKNPYHLRKYTFEAFQELTSAVLGDTTCWLAGYPMIGYANIPISHTLHNTHPDTQRDMLQTSQSGTAVLHPTPVEFELCVEKASYFCGVWGNNSMSTPSTASYALNMEAFSSKTIPSEIKDSTEQHIEDLEREIYYLKHQQWKWVPSPIRKLYRRVRSG